MKLKNIKTVIVDYKKWAMGSRPVEIQSSLLNSDGHRCCLGFECKQRGIPDNILRYLLRPERVSEKIKIAIPGMTKKITTPHVKYVDADLIQECVKANDDRKITNKERIRELIGLFQQRKLKLKFINVPKKFGGPIVQ